MDTVYAPARITWLLSYCREGVPKHLIVSTALGLPIIASDGLCCPEIVRPAKHDLLVPE